MLLKYPPTNAILTNAILSRNGSAYLSPNSDAVDTGAVDPVIWGCRLYGLSENQTDLEVHYPFKCLFRRPVGLPAVGGRGRQVKGQLMRFELGFSILPKGGRKLRRCHRHYTRRELLYTIIAIIGIVSEGILLVDLINFRVFYYRSL